MRLVCRTIGCEALDRTQPGLPLFKGTLSTVPH